jgi:hypothetical protein
MSELRTRTFYVTFGPDQTPVGGGFRPVTVRKTDDIDEDRMRARVLTIEAVGDRFCSIYDELEHVHRADRTLVGESINMTIGMRCDWDDE